MPTRRGGRERKLSFSSLVVEQRSAIRYILWSRQKIPLSYEKNLVRLKFAKKKEKKRTFILIKCYLTSVKTRVLLRTLCSRKGIEGGPFVLMDTFVRRLLYIYIYIYTLYIYILYIHINRCI